MIEWSLIVMVWLSTMFGGEGSEPSRKFPQPLPMRVEITFPQERGCRELVKALRGPAVPEGSPERPLVRNIILQDCAPVVKVPIIELQNGVKP